MCILIRRYVREVERMKIEGEDGDKGKSLLFMSCGHFILLGPRSGHGGKVILELALNSKCSETGNKSRSSWSPSSNESMSERRLSFFFFLCFLHVIFLIFSLVQILIHAENLKVVVS